MSTSKRAFQKHRDKPLKHNRLHNKKTKLAQPWGYIEPGYHILEWWVRKIDKNPFET